MTEAEKLILQYLCAIREQLETMNERALHLTQRVGNLVVQMTNLSVFVDCIDVRLARVERRLGLVGCNIAGSNLASGYKGYDG